MSEDEKNEPKGRWPNWSPERKLVGAAVATVAVWLGQVFSGENVPIGVEGAIAVLVAYFLPNKKKK